MSFDAEKLERIAYYQTAPFALVKRFLNDSDRFLKELFNEAPVLFDSPPRSSTTRCGLVIGSAPTGNCTILDN
jgi:hypothetical protein